MNLSTTPILAIAAVICAMTPFSTMQAQAPTDPQIVGIVVAANDIDINSGKLAMTKAHNKQVRDFAHEMVSDHTAVQKSVMELGAKLQVTPAESEAQASLRKQAEETMTKLKGLSGKAFDKAYIDNEVAYHSAVIHEVSTVLIPDAQNAELKSALQGAAPMFQGHLEHAKMIQSSINGKDKD